MDHAAMLSPVVAGGQQGPEHDVGSVHLEGRQRIIDGSVEAKASNDSSQVSTSTHQSRHHSQLLLVHERHNAVAGSFCHLHEEGEANEDSEGNIPWLRIVYQSEAEQEDCLKEEGQELCPGAATEANILEEDVTGDASQGPGKEIHQAKTSCQGRGICRSHLEVGPEMSSQLVVHCQFCSEASTILHDHHHNADVLQHLHIVPQRWFLGLASHCHIKALCSGGVPTQELHGSCATHKEHSRNNHSHPPCSVCFHARVHHGVEQHGNHEDLGHTTTLPHPAAVALAVPTTLGLNIKEHQNWLVTNVAPANTPQNPRVLKRTHMTRAQNIQSQHCRWRDKLHSAKLCWTCVCNAIFVYVCNWVVIKNSIVDIANGNWSMATMVQLPSTTKIYQGIGLHSRWRIGPRCSSMVLRWQQPLPPRKLQRSADRIGHWLGQSAPTECQVQCEQRLLRPRLPLQHCNHPIACSPCGANTLGQHLRPVLILLPVCCSHSGCSLWAHHCCSAPCRAGNTQGQTSSSCTSGMPLVWDSNRLGTIGSHTGPCWRPPQAPKVPKQTNQGRPGRKKWWRPRTLACVGFAAHCRTHVGVAIPWPCCSHPLPTWSPTCWNLQSSDYCDSRCNFYCAKRLEPMICVHF